MSKLTLTAVIVAMLAGCGIGNGGYGTKRPGIQQAPETWPPGEAKPYPDQQLYEDERKKTVQ